MISSMSILARPVFLHLSILWPKLLKFGKLNSSVHFWIFVVFTLIFLFQIKSQFATLVSFQLLEPTLTPAGCTVKGP